MLVSIPEPRAQEMKSQAITLADVYLLHCYQVQGAGCNGHAAPRDSQHDPGVYIKHSSCPR